MKKSGNSESGYLLIEAAIVYPIVIVLLAAFLYILLLFGQKAQMTSAAEQTLVYIKYLCAGNYTDIDISNLGAITPPENTSQRYNAYSNLFSTPTKTLNELKGKTSGVDKITPIFQHYMGNSTLIGKLSDYKVDCNAHNYVIFTQIDLSVSYTINSPINFSFIGGEELNNMTIKADVMGVISNNAETIRTTQFVSYGYHRSGIAKKVNDGFDKVIEKCKEWMKID